MENSELIAIIEHAKENKWLELNLSNKGRTYPTEIGRPHVPRQIHFSSYFVTRSPIKDSDQLTELPAEIGQLNKLESLFVERNQLTQIPREFNQLQNLQELSLRENQLINLPPEIGELANLQKLDLSSNNLSELPSEIGNLKELRELDLGFNQLRKLPAEIRSLTVYGKLKLLDLTANNLTEIPSLSHSWTIELGKVAPTIYKTTLETLNLAGNPINGLSQHLLYSTSDAKVLIYHLENRELEWVDELTPREWEVLERLARHMTNKEIATELNISPETVKFHLREIFKKLKVSKRGEAATLYTTYKARNIPD